MTKNNLRLILRFLTIFFKINILIFQYIIYFFKDGTYLSAVDDMGVGDHLTSKVLTTLPMTADGLEVSTMEMLKMDTQVHRKLILTMHTTKQQENQSTQPATQLTTQPQTQPETQPHKLYKTKQLTQLLLIPC